MEAHVAMVYSTTPQAPDLGQTGAPQPAWEQSWRSAEEPQRCADCPSNPRRAPTATPAVDTGEPDLEKRARPVRAGVFGRFQPCWNSPRPYLVTGSYTNAGGVVPPQGEPVSNQHLDSSAVGGKAVP